MALSDISIETKTITFDGGSFDVRGLSFSDLIGLFRTHKEQVAAIFGLVNDLSTDDNIDALIGNIFEVAPDAFNMAIALAADEPEMVDTVKRLPLPVVSEAAMAVASLTFKSEEELVNFIERLTEMVSKATDKLAPASPQIGS